MMGTAISCRDTPPPRPFDSDHFSGGIRILSWSGQVVGRIVIAYSPYKLEYQTAWGSRVISPVVQRDADMPQAPGLCYIDKKDTTIKMTLLSQPTTENTHTCEVLVFNPSDEPAACNFDLFFLPHEEGL
jgi:hypothetical protein